MVSIEAFNEFLSGEGERPEITKEDLIRRILGAYQVATKRGGKR